MHNKENKAAGHKGPAVGYKEIVHGRPFGNQISERNDAKNACNGGAYSQSRNKQALKTFSFGTQPTRQQNGDPQVDKGGEGFGKEGGAYFFEHGMGLSIWLYRSMYC